MFTPTTAFLSNKCSVSRTFVEQGTLAQEEAEYPSSYILAPSFVPLALGVRLCEKQWQPASLLTGKVSELMVATNLLECSRLFICWRSLRPPDQKVLVVIMLRLVFLHGITLKMLLWRV